MASLSAVDWAWGLRTREWECSGTVMLSKLTVGMAGGKFLN